MTIRLDATEFNASLTALEDDLRKAAIAGAEDAGGLLADAWRLHVPVLAEERASAVRGAYRDRIHSYLEQASALGASVIVTSGLRQDYDVFLEFGTHLSSAAARLAKLHPVLASVIGWRMRPHPSLRPAIEMTREILGETLTKPSEQVLG